MLTLFRMFIVFSLTGLLTACNANKTKEDISENVMKAEKPDEGQSVEHINEKINEIASMNIMVQKIAGEVINNAANEEVVQLAELVNEKHKEAEKKIKFAMESENANYPKSLSPDQQKTVQNLNSLKGNDYERKFISIVIEEHNEAIEILNNISESTTSVNTKNLVKYLHTELNKLEDKAKTVQSNANQIISY